MTKGNRYHFFLLETHWSRLTGGAFLDGFLVTTRLSSITTGVFVCATADGILGQMTRLPSYWRGVFDGVLVNLLLDERSSNTTPTPTNNFLAIQKKGYFCLA